MNTELEQTLLEIAESQDALKENLLKLEMKIDMKSNKLEKKINNLEESKNLLSTITTNHSDSICENIENIELLNENITILRENLNENIEIFNSNDDNYNKNIEEFKEFKESVTESFNIIARRININNERLDDFLIFFNKKTELDDTLGTKYTHELKLQIEDLQRRITIVAKEGDAVYLSYYGDTTKFKIVSIIGDEVILKYSSWWLPRLLGNDRYINVPKNEIYYKDKKNYIIL